jgi:hypothetical protein
VGELCQGRENATVSVGAYRQAIGRGLASDQGGGRRFQAEPNGTAINPHSVFRSDSQPQISGNPMAFVEKIRGKARPLSPGMPSVTDVPAQF